MSLLGDIYVAEDPEGVPESKVSCTVGFLTGLGNKEVRQGSEVRDANEMVPVGPGEVARFWVYYEGTASRLDVDCGREETNVTRRCWPEQLEGWT